MQCATWSSPSNCCAAIVGLFFDIDMGQDQAGFGVECVQQLGGFAVVEVVETSPERLPIQRDTAPRWISCGIPQTSGVAAEHPLDSLCVEALEDIANGGMGGRTLPAQTEGGVQPSAMHFDEGRQWSGRNCHR